jgi:hypothetical protein
MEENVALMAAMGRRTVGVTLECGSLLQYLRFACLWGMLLPIESLEDQVQFTNLRSIFNVIELINHEAKLSRILIAQWIAAYHVVQIYVLDCLQKYHKVSLCDPRLMVIIRI